MFLESAFCSEAAPIFKFIGQIIWIFKIIIPVALIVWGVYGLGKAVISADDKDIKTQVNALIKKIIVGIVIFFIPYLVKAIFSLVEADSYNDSTICITCITTPSECPTK